MSVKESDTVITALQKIKDNGVTGVGIVNEAGKLIGTFDSPENFNIHTISQAISAQQT